MRQRVAVFILDNGTILLLHRIKNGKEYYAVPGGGMEPGETEQSAAVREIKEETGLDIVLGKKLGTLELDGELQQFYIAKSFRGKPELGGPEKERQSPKNIYKLEWVPLEKLDQIALREEIKELLFRYINPSGQLKAPKRRNSILIPYRIRGGVTEVYLQKRAEDAVRLPDHFGFFGGGAEENETPKQALLREIKEELDYAPHDYRFFGQYEFPGSTKWIYTLAAPTDFESQIKVVEGQYGKWFSESDATKEPLLIEDDKKVLRDFFARKTADRFLGKSLTHH